MRRRTFLAAAVAALGLPAALAAPPVSAAAITGGRGGRILRVTTLASEGPGSITEAIKAKGPRIVVFEVGGVIDLGMKTLRINAGDLTIAGQTAPSLVTFIRGGVAVSADNVVLQHIAVRPGEAGQAKGSGWECDGVYAYGASRVEVSSCSITWATDEGLSASGPRFEGAALADWRANTSHLVRFRNNLVAESLSNSTHSKGEHSKGTLIHDNVRDVEITGSLYAHNVERNILLKGGTQAAFRGNVVYNPGKRFSHFNLNATDWEGHPWEPSDMAVEDNVFLAGPSTASNAVAFNLGGEGPLTLSMRNNLALDAAGAPLPQFGRSGSKTAALTDRFGDAARANPADPSAHRAMMETVLATCGARPWDRDPIDARIVADVRTGGGRIIDSEQEVGGYPVRPATQASFRDADWDLDALTRL